MRSIPITRNTIGSLILWFSTSLSAGKYHPAIEYIHPLPGSRLHPPGATVILRLHHEYNALVTDLDGLIGLSANTGVKKYTGHTIRARDEKTLLFIPDNALPRGASFKVTLQMRSLGLADYEFDFSTAAADFNVPKASANSADDAEAPSGRQVLGNMKAPKMVNGVVLPENYPEINTRVLGETAPGHITFGGQMPTGNFIIMCDNEGNPYFFRKFDEKITGNVLLHFTDDHPEGLLTAQMNYNPGSYYIFDHHFEHVNTYHSGHGYRTDNHECHIMRNGHVLMVCQDFVNVDLSKVVAGASTNRQVFARHFQELDRDHRVVFEWRGWDYFELTDVVYTPASDGNVNITAKTGTFDSTHLNSIAVDNDGHYLISCKSLCELTKINSKTGEIIWRFGSGPKNEFTFLDPGIADIGYQHDLRPVPGKQNEYTLFDNGNNRHPDLFSRALHVRLDPEKKTIEKVWQFRYTPDRYSYMKGAVQLLENGNYYIDWSTNRGDTGIFGCEVTPAGDVVFEIHVPNATTYRTRRYDWDACAAVPELLVENYGHTVRLIYNKFGDKTVKSYNVYYGTSKNPETLLAITDVPYLDVPAGKLAHRKTNHFRVTAVDSSGEESDYSNEETTFVIASTTDENMVVNGDFSNGFHFWVWRNDNNGKAAYSINADGMLHIAISDGGSEYYHVQANYPNLPLVQGREYLFEFDAYADANRLIEAEIRKASDPFTYYSKIGTTSLRRTNMHFAYRFIMTEISDSQARIVMNVGNSDADVYIDNVSLKDVTNTNVDETDVLPVEFGLDQNFPNPFNPKTAICYQLSTVSRVRLEVFDIAGRVVSVLRDKEQAAGLYRVEFDGSPLSSGVYFFRLSAAGADRRFVAVKKMALVR